MTASAGMAPRTPLDGELATLVQAVGEGGHQVSEAERDLLRMRFATRPPLTLQEVADILGWTRARVRHTEISLVASLRGSRLRPVRARPSTPP